MGGQNRLMLIQKPAFDADFPEFFKTCVVKQPDLTGCKIGCQTNLKRSRHSSPQEPEPRQGYPTSR